MSLFNHIASRWMTLFIPATSFVLAASVKWHQPITMANYIAMMLTLYVIITIWELITTPLCKCRFEVEEISFQKLYFLGLCIIFTLLIVLRT